MFFRCRSRISIFTSRSSSNEGTVGWLVGWLVGGRTLDFAGIYVKQMFWLGVKCPKLNGFL